VGDLTTRFDTYPGLEQYTVDVDHYAVVDGKYLYFDLPFTSTLFHVGADRRALPYYISWRSDDAIHTTIDLPADFRRVVMAPRSEELDAPDDGGKALVTIKTTDSGCDLNEELETSPAIVDPKDYSAMLKVESTLAQKSSKTFVLEKN
jgi:hypothetical protein